MPNRNTLIKAVFPGAVGVVPFNTHSLFLAGGNEYVNIDSLLTNSLATTTQGTWAQWIKPVNATPVGSEFLINFGDTDANEGIQTSINTIDGKFRVFCRIAGVTQWDFKTTDIVFSDNTWAHWMLIQDGVEPRLYINKILVAQSFSVSLSKGKWFNDMAGLDNGRIGDRNFNGGGETTYFNGNMDEIRFWNIALNAAQRADEYNNGCPKAPLETGLVSSFRIDGDTVPTCVDSFGANNGTYVNVVQNEIQEVTVC